MPKRVVRTTRNNAGPRRFYDAAKDAILRGQREGHRREERAKGATTEPSSTNPKGIERLRRWKKGIKLKQPGE
jgi:hypothetical protein